MANSRFIFDKTTIDDFFVIATGSIVCHKNELSFNFQGFSIKMAFLEDPTKSSNGMFELEKINVGVTLKCYNLKNVLGSSTTEPFELARFNLSPNTSQEEVLYIAFSVVIQGTTRVIHYTFFTKIRQVKE